MNMNTSKKQEGFVIVAVAIVLIVLVGFLALAIDIGVLYSARTSAQGVADAAALAGAYTYIVNPTAPNLEQLAHDSALQVALNNSIMGQPVAEADVTVNPDPANRRVTVDVQSTQNTYFARAFGVETASVGAQAVAEAAKYAAGSPCTKPWFIPNTAMSLGGACAACGSNEVMISGGEVTAFAQSKFGTEFRVTSNDPANQLAPGQFYAFDLTRGGGDDYRDNIATCVNTYARCLDSYSVLTGDKVGPTQQGVTGLIGNPPDDTWVSLGQYQTPQGLSDSSKNVVVAPIWDTCGMAGFCPGENFPSGTNVNLQIIGFAIFFLEGINGNDVMARLINVASCSSSTETGGTVLSLPLRLVRTQ